MTVSSPDSDSDGEPNSQGAKVFWGNLKTPERSRSIFVDPPKTVVRSTALPHSRPRQNSASSSIAAGADCTVLNVDQEETIEHQDGGTVDTPRVRASLRRTVTVDDMENIDQPNPNALHTDIHAMDTLPQPHSSPHRTFSADPGSESEVEEDAVLQPSSPLDPVVPPMDVDTRSDSSENASRQSPSDTLNLALRAPRTLDLPDLISFDLSTPTPLLPNGSRTHSLEQPHATHPHQSSSSSSTVDDLLALSPQHTTTRSPPRPSLSQVEPETESEAMSLEASKIPLPPSPVVVPAPSNVRPSLPQPFSGTPPTLPDRRLSPVASTSPPISHSLNDTSSSGRADQTCGSLAGGLILLAGKLDSVLSGRNPKPLYNSTVQMPAHAPAIQPPTSGAETRKCSPAKAWKGKEKAGPGESSIEMPDETTGELNNMNDKAAKKERRLKAKQEAERKRQQLLSLSPNSAGLLNLLASPDRGSPSRSPAPTSPNGIASDFAFDFSTPQSKAPTSVTPEVGASSSPRRVPISNASLQRPHGQFIRPTPVFLDDPNRTPARRVPVAMSASQALPHPLPLDDPNRTPARRVAITMPKPDPSSKSPARRVPLGTHAVSAEMSSASSAAKSNTLERPTNGTTPSSFASSSATSWVARPLPFPFARRPAEGEKKPQTDSSDPSLRPDSAASSKPSSTSSLRQPSSISSSKIARVASKPYSRPVNANSKLPKPSSRLPVSSVAQSSSVTNKNTGRGNITVTATRIPSPVKRRAPSPGLSEHGHSVPTLSANTAPSADKARMTTTYRRKRQRMMTEDSDHDEPPPKRPVIVVRPVTKGMYNKAALASPPSTFQKELSPVRQARRPGPIQIRPVIPGTLGHFETTRSSSRDLFKRTEEAAHASDVTATSPSDVPRAETPVVDTDTASTVTTLSREPTLEDLPGSSSDLARYASPPTLAEPAPELRRTTRVRKPCGPEILATSSASSTATASKHEPIALSRTTTMVHRGATPSSKATSRSTTRALETLGLPTNPRQLQALTDANTVRNQAYLADLQRKVVRKDGPRPASPTTKIRTIMEKSKEERTKDREARAERRRRRGEGSGVSTSSDGDYMDVPSSPMPEDQEPPIVPKKHARGPGDEEEYETPVRPPKPRHLDSDKVVKNVKWDRGLAKTISEWAAEQAAKQAQEGAAAEAIRKGCLARDPTTLRLDPLGNVPEVNVPLDHLGRERVIVTRFVYDDDIEASYTAKKRKT